MATKTVGFAVAEEDEPRLERLVRKYADGNRSAFLRAAMDHMEALDRAERLGALQRFGAEGAASTGLSHEDAVAVVRRVLAKR